MRQRTLARLLQPRSGLTGVFKTTAGFAWIVAYFALGIFSLYWLVVIQHHDFGGDYHIYLNAYVNARAGANPYDPYSVGSGFVSHPIVMILVRLLFFKDEHLSLILWSSVSLLAWTLSLAMATFLVPRGEMYQQGSLSSTIRTASLPALFLVFGPLLETITVGQIDTIALLFVLGSLLFSELGLPLPAGISIGLAILLKTSPVVFLVYFALTRQHKVLIFAVIAIVVLSIFSGIPFLGDVNGQFLRILPNLTNEVHPTRYNLSLGSTVSRLFGGSVSSLIETNIPTANKVLLAFATVSLSLLSWRRGYASKDRRLWLFAGFQILALMFSPLLWYHHFTFMLFPIVLFLQEPSAGVRALALISLTLIEAERYFEAFFQAMPWPCLAACILMLGICYVYFSKSEFPDEPRVSSGQML